MHNHQPYLPPSATLIDTPSIQRPIWWIFIAIPLALLVSRATNELYWSFLAGHIPGAGIAHEYVTNFLGGFSDFLGGMVLAKILRRKSGWLGLLLGVCSFIWWFIRNDFPFDVIDIHFIIRNIYFIVMFYCGAKMYPAATLTDHQQAGNPN